MSPFSQFRVELKPSAPQEYDHFAVNFADHSSGKMDLADSSIEMTGSANPLKDPKCKHALEANISTNISEDRKRSLKSRWENKNVSEIAAVFKDGSGNPMMGWRGSPSSSARGPLYYHVQHCPPTRYLLQITSTRNADLAAHGRKKI